MGGLSEEEIAPSDGSLTPRGSAALMLDKKASGFIEFRQRHNNYNKKHPINPRTQ